MEPPIIVEYRGSAEDLIQGYRYYFRQMCRPIFRVCLHFIFALIAIGGFIGVLQYCDILFDPKDGVSSPIAPIGCVIVGLYWFILRGFDFRWTIRRRYAQRPDRDMNVVWKITQDKIVVQNCLGHSEFIWKAVIKAVRTPSGLMLYGLENMWWYLPLRGFANEADFEKVVALAKSQVPKFCSVT